MVANGCLEISHISHNKSWSFVCAIHPLHLNTLTIDLYQTKSCPFQCIFYFILWGCKKSVNYYIRLRAVHFNVFFTSFYEVAKSRSIISFRLLILSNHMSFHLLSGAFSVNIISFLICKASSLQAFCGIYATA